MSDLSDNELMRIALMTHDIPGAGTSGVGSYTLHCAAALARHGEHEPHIFTFAARNQTPPLLPPGVHLHSLPDLGDRVAHGQISEQAGAVLGISSLPGQIFARSELLCEGIRQVHRNAPFDIVESPDVCCPGLPLLIRPIPGLPTVTMLHAGTAISRQYNEFVPSSEDQLLMALEFAGIALADGVCAPTRAVVEATRRFIAFPHDVDVFPSPVPSRESHHSSPPTSDSGGYVMFAGRLERLKGCCELALAANTFLRACPEAELRLYGPDRPLPSVLKIVPLEHKGHPPWNGGTTRQWMLAHLDPAVRERVRFMGTASAQGMVSAYAGCRFVVVPSRFENFGTTAAEALVAQRPVLYAAGTGLEETVADAGLSAHVEDPEHLASEMIRLWNDGHLRAALVARGNDRLRNELSVDSAVARRVTFYRKVMAQGPLDIQEKVKRLAAVPPEALFALLRYASGLTATLAGVGATEALSPGARAAHALDSLRRKGTPLASVWLYGGGEHTRRMLVEKHVIQQSGLRICGIIDDAARPGDTLYDLPVITRTMAEQRHRDHEMTIDALLLSSDSLEETLWSNAEHFRREHVPVVRLYS